jgi:hypothetical protein
MNNGKSTVMTQARSERLRQERKGRPVKVDLARRLRRKTTMTLQWIAENLEMGTWTHVSNRFRASPSQRLCVKDKD